LEKLTRHTEQTVAVAARQALNAFDKRLHYMEKTETIEKDGSAAEPVVSRETMKTTPKSPAAISG
jgi:hypothetical protein